jgi:hypothetical protein
VSVRATTRREQIRRPNGDRVILPGAQDATGLSALAAVSAGADTITGAARHATQADVIEPAAEARILFESLKGTGAALSNDALPVGVTKVYGYINTDLGDRRDNSGWGVCRCDVDLCDDPQSQAGTDATAGNAELNATDAPAIYTFTTALDRALANAQADPALTPWALSSAPLRVNMFPSPSSEVAGVPVAWVAPFGATLTDVAAAGFAGSRHLRLTSTAGGFVGVDSDPFGWVEPGQSVTAQIHAKGTAPTVRVSLTTTAGGGFVDGTALALTASWSTSPATVTYTHPVDKPAARLILSVSAVGTTAAQTVDFDAVLVEAGSAVGAYFDPTYGSGNPVLNAGLDAGVTSWAGSLSTLSWLSTGGRRGGGAGRITSTAGANVAYAVNGTAFPIVAGTPFALHAWVKGSRVGVNVSLRATYTGAAAVTFPTVALTGDWQLITAVTVAPVGATALRPDIRVANSGVAPQTGDTLDFDDVVANVGAQGILPYVDTVAWVRGTEVGPSAAYAAGPAGAYSRPIDAGAPQLDLPGSTWVHRRTGTLTAGDRISSPWQACTYGLVSGRTFTVAAWLATTPTVGTLPALRWVLELALDPGAQGSAFIIATSPPFSPADVYQRFAAVLTPPIPSDLFGAPVTAVRAHLEVVNPGSIGAGATVSIRGAHLYAGADRGDAAGLDAVVLTAPVRWTVDIDDDDAFLATRVDVHGNDRVTHITAASGAVNYLGGTSQQIHGASAGRLTMRVPDPDAAGLLDSVFVLAEEINGGPGASLSLQNVRVWHEVDATADVVSLTVDRSTDADPGSSTVPIGNYAATTIDVELDDSEGTWSLFGRRYIDLGHRIEAAIGVTYTNRCDDPLGIDADLLGSATLTWPTALPGDSPVVQTTADRFGQMPPAPFVGHATAQLAYDTFMRTMTPALEGSSMRGQVWVRYTGDTVPTLYAAAVRRYEVPGAGVAVSVDPATVTPLTVPDGPNVWRLVKVPTLTIPLGSNAIAVSGSFGLSDPDRWLELGAPDFERLDPATGDLIEVVETAPAGVFTSTSWDGGTGGDAVQVSGIDVLATAGAGDLGGTIHVDTTVEAELRDVARRYLDLGADQVVIVDQGTPVPYAIPASKVSTQIADLAKVATLTAFTDGAGRFTALLRQEVDPNLAARYLGDRNLVKAASSIAPDVVKNDVRVTAHPIARAVGIIGTAGNSTATDTTVAGWTLTGQEIYVPPGETVTEVIIGWQVDGALDGVVVNPVGWFSWQVGAANPYNVFNAPGGTYPMPPGSTWTIGSGLPWVEVELEVYATFGVVRFINHEVAAPVGQTPDPYAPAVWVDHIEVSGSGLTVTSIAQRFIRESSVEAFGVQGVDVDVRLAQSSILLPGIGADVLDNFSLRDPDGERWLPDLEATVLADPWRELGDRVLIGDVDSSISGEYRVLTHTLTVGVGAESELYLRRVPVGVDFAVTDISLADDGKVASY